MHEFRSRSVGFQFHVTTEAADDFGAVHLCRVIEIAAAGKDVGGGSKNCGGRLLGRSPAVVTFCDVAYLMGNNTGQLGFSF